MPPRTGIGPFNAGLRNGGAIEGTRDGIPVREPQDYLFLDPRVRNDPRGFGRGYQGGSYPPGSGIINDERAMGDTAARVADGVADINDVLARLEARNKPPQLKQVPFHAFIAAAATPVLLIPFNARRLGILVSNYRQVSDGAGGLTGINGICFSFGEPLQTANGELSGIPLTPCYQETNGTISVDAIYVFCNNSGATFPIPILGYEANLALGKSNPR